MPVAAVPEYIQKNCAEFYLNAPPGHRFLLYFPVWGFNQETQKIDWSKKDRVPVIDKKTSKQKTDKFGLTWDNLTNDQYACTIAAGKMPIFDDLHPRAIKPSTDLGLKPWLPLLQGLATRQLTLVSTLPANQLLSLDALAVAPFTTGLGNEHPLENGFAFLNPYGLPYLPGSGVKGVLRQAAQELASGEWGDQQGWSAEKIHTFTTNHGKTTIELSPIDALFGLESTHGSDQSVRGALTFWDVIPQIKGDALAVDIMTPHQSHYYQQKTDGKSGNSTNPHESGQPTPISFLTVPAGSAFSFHITCDLAHLELLAPDLAVNERWKAVLTAAFEHAFQWLGFGAKTSVGYGAMQSESQREQEQAQARIQQAQEAARQREAAAQRQAASALPWPGAQIKFNRANGALTATKEGKQAVATAPKGRELLDTLPAELRRKIETNQFVRVTAFVAENVLVKVQA